MARRQLTPAQIKARTEKARKTREANKRKALEQLGLQTERKKPKRARKPMTEQQKKAAAERLAKARKAKQKKEGTPKYSQYAEEVVALPDEHPLSLKNVKQYLKTSQQLLESIKDLKDSKVAAHRLQYMDVSVYVDNLKSYMRSGVFTDFRVGNDRENKLKLRCFKMAYYADGTPKRTVGVWYPDIGTEWTREMEKAA